jgi:hypothetical protein
VLIFNFHIDFAYWHSGAVSLKSCQSIRESFQSFTTSPVYAPEFSRHQHYTPYMYTYTPTHGTHIHPPTHPPTHTHTYTHTHTHTHTHTQSDAEPSLWSQLNTFLQGVCQAPPCPPHIAPTPTRHLPLPLSLDPLTTVSSCAHALH